MLKPTRIFPSSNSLTLAGERLLEPILQTENLWKVYRQGKVEVPALRGVSIEIFPGEFVSIMGPSGCGKSTMLHVIGGLAQATSGRVLLDGNDLTTMSDSARTLLRRHKVGFVFQRFNLLPTLDAYHNITLAQHIHGNGFDPHRFQAVASSTSLQSFPVANNSASRSLARSSANQKSSWPMNPPATSIPKAPKPSSACSASSIKISAKPSS